MLSAYLLLALAQTAPPPVVPVAVNPPPPGGFVLPLPPPPIKFVPIAKPAEPLMPLRAYFSPDDYPGAAMEARQQGKASLFLTISPEGRVVRCKITRSSGSAALDRASCGVVSRRSRWSPALGFDGSPVFGTYAHEVTWKL